MLAQLELILEQLAANGGGWGTAAALLWIGWRVWKELKPSVRKWLELKTREVTANERNAAAREESLNTDRDLAKGLHGLTGAVQGLTEAAGNNGFKHDTGKLAHGNDAKKRN